MTLLCYLIHRRGTGKRYEVRIITVTWKHIYIRIRESILEVFVAKFPHLDSLFHACACEI